MGKSRMTVLDVKAAVASLRTQLLGSRVANVYDLDPKTYLIKTAKGGSKTLVLLESGIRFHSTAYMRDKSNTPSGFSLKLRKHIRTKRVEEVRQLGVDRVVAFTFGAADEAVHLILELFAGGNIILVDNTFTILALLRTHTDEATGAKTAVRETYPMEGAENRKISRDLLVAAISTGAQNEKTSIKDALIRELDYGPALVEHAMLGAGIDVKRKASSLDCSEGSTDADALMRAFADVDAMIDGLSAEGKVVPGFIIRKNDQPDSAYDDFGPILLRQFQGRAVSEFESFDKAMDAYFTVAEDQRLEQQKEQQQKAVVSKVERVRKAHEAQVQALQEEQEHNFLRARLIEHNLGDVDNAILVVNSLLSQGTDWNTLKKMVKEEARKGNPIASLIHGLKLASNQVTLLLTFGLDCLDEEEQTLPVTAVDVDLGLNAYTNAQGYYQYKKKVAHKAEKTLAASEKALKGATRKAKDELNKVEVKASIQHIRKTHWFEKFIWFVSSENFLVLCGRDAQQNELLVKRYLSKGDIYLHADIHGAAAHVIKNHTQEAVPPLTLAQAGLSCVCRSNAWDAKMVTSAYWVHPEQVSKSAPTGEYLSTGSFMIRGKKNYLPPNPLVMGFGLLFKVDESCLAHHIGERRIRGLGEKEAEAESVKGSVAGTEEEAPQSGGEDEDEDEEGAEPVGSEPKKEGGLVLNAPAGSIEAVPEAAAEEEADGKVEEDDAGNRASGEEEEGGEDEPAQSDQATEVDAAPAPTVEVQALTTEAVRLRAGQGSETSSPVGSTASSVASTVPYPSRGSSRSGVDAGMRMRVDAHNIDEGNKGFDGIRVGAGVSMAAFIEDEDEDEAASQQDRPQTQGKRHLSAAERKRMKKGGGVKKEEEAQEGNNSVLEEMPEKGKKKVEKGEQKAGGKGKDGANNSKQQQQQQQQQQVGKRGQNAKKKKMQKYVDQDEDEREMAMVMLGHKRDGARNPADADADDDNNNDESREEARAEAVSAEPTGLAAAVDARLQGLFVEGKCTRGDFDGQTLAKLREFSDADALDILERFAEAEILSKVKNKAAFLSGICHRYRDRKAKEEKEEKKREKEEVSRLNKEEGIVELDEDEKDKLVDLDSFTALPRADDILHYCLPVCAPYFAMQAYKFKVKLTPGQGKKGKVAKQAQAMFQKDATPRERELIKVVGDHEMVMQMVGNARISTPAKK